VPGIFCFAAQCKDRFDWLFVFVVSWGDYRHVRMLLFLVVSYSRRVFFFFSSVTDAVKHELETMSLFVVQCFFLSLRPLPPPTTASGSLFLRLETHPLLFSFFNSLLGVPGDLFDAPAFLPAVSPSGGSPSKVLAGSFLLPRGTPLPFPKVSLLTRRPVLFRFLFPSPFHVDCFVSLFFF